MDSRGRRNVMDDRHLIDAMLYGGIFIFCMILGMGMEMVLRR